MNDTFGYKCLDFAFNRCVCFPMWLTDASEHKWIRVAGLFAMFVWFPVMALCLVFLVLPALLICLIEDA